MSGIDCVIQTALAVVFWHAPQLLPLAAGVLLSLMAAVIWLYPAQLRLVGWTGRILLPLLRTLALAALAVSLLKPVAVRLASAGERGTLLVLVDHSRSMSVVDNQRTAAQLVALADALGRLPAGARVAPLAELQGVLSRLRVAAQEVQAARDDLDFALISGRDVEPRQSRLRDLFAAYSTGARALATGAAVPDDPDLRQRLAEIAEIPQPDSETAWKSTVPMRISQAVTALARYQEHADNHLYDANPQVHEACDQVRRVSRFDLAQEALLRPGKGILSRVSGQMPVSGFLLADRAIPVNLFDGAQPVHSLAGQPNGFESDLTGGIPSAAGGRAVRAILMISDGRQVGGDARRVTGLTPNGVPIFTVGISPASGPRDLSFADVLLPSGAFVGDTVTLRAQVRHEGFEGMGVDVKLRIADQPEQSQHVELRSAIPAAVSFPIELKPSLAGVRKIVLSVAPLPGEMTNDNNRIERWIKVMPERIKVAAWAGSPGWDYQYFHNLLARRTDVQLRDAVLAGEDSRLTMSPEEILRQDVIVMFDVPVSALSSAQWDALLRLVDERGGSVILVAGDAHLPAEYANPIPAATLLPFDLSRVQPRFKTWPGEQPAFRFIPDPGALNLEVLELGNDPSGIPRRWEELPPTFQFLQLPPVSEGKLKPRTQALLAELDSGSPVLLERRLGAGRTLFLGINETWRWRFKVGERDQDRFWRQLIHYAAQAPYFANSESLALDADRVSVQPDEPVHVRARVFDEKQSPRSYDLDIFREQKRFGTQKLILAGSPGAGQYEANLLLPSGEYELQLTSNRETVRMPLRVAAGDEAEMANLTGDNDLLRRIAESSGGEFFTLDQIGHLPDRLSRVAETRSRFADLRLWDSPYLYLFVVGLFSAEWAIRKRCGLA